MKFAGCDGISNAWYESDGMTILESCGRAER